MNAVLETVTYAMLSTVNTYLLIIPFYEPWYCYNIYYMLCYHICYVIISVIKPVLLMTQHAIK